MKPVRLIATAASLAVLAVLATHVQAQQSNSTEQTFLTFSGPVELPGVVLEPGTYEFRLANANQSRNVVQVFRKDTREPIGQWTFVQTSRPKVSDETVVMFKENKEGTTPAVQYWYYPGEKIGKEFIYPKDQAERIAARTGQTVRTEDGSVGPTATADASASRQPEPNPAPAPNASAAATTPERAPVSQTARAETSSQEPPAADRDADAAQRNAPAAAQPSAPAGSTTGSRGVTPSAQASAQASADSSVGQARESAPVGTSGRAAAQDSGAASQSARAELPRTASPLALTGLMGLLSLAGGFGIRTVRR